MLRDAQRSPGNAQRRFRKKEELPIPIVADDPLTGRLRACESVSVCIWIDARWGVVERKKWLHLLDKIMLDKPLDEGV